MSYNDKKKTALQIDEFVLVQNTSRYNLGLNDVRIEEREIDRDGKLITVYTLYDADGIKIGDVVNDNLKLEPNYEKTLKQSHGKFYKEYGIKSGIAKVDIEKTIENELRKEEEQRKQEQINKTMVEADSERHMENNTQPKEADIDKEKNEQQTVKKTSTEKKKNSEEVKTYSEEDLKKYTQTKIKDEEFIKDFIDTTKYDIFSIKVIMIDNKPIVMARKMNTKEYVEIPAKLQRSYPIGEIDSIENGEEKEIGNGYEMTFVNKFGKYKTLDIRNEHGKINVSVKKDLDNDQIEEALSIDTDMHEAKPQAQKTLDKYMATNRYNTFDSEEKEENDVKPKELDTDETIEGSLSDSQIREILNSEVTDEDVRRKVIEEVDKYNANNNMKNPTATELREMIENCKEYQKEDEEKYDYYSEPVHEHRLEPKRPPVF